MKRMNCMIAFMVFTLWAMPTQAQLLKSLGKKLKEKTEQMIRSTVTPNSPAALTGVTGPADTLTIRSDCRLMRVTSETKFISMPGVSKVSDMHEGMFGVVCNGYDWAFFDKEGRMVFNAEWRNPTGKDADVRFDNGAVIMSRKSASGRADRLCILYSNGTIKELPSHYTRPTQFVDGVARVLKQAAQQSGGTYVYIDTSGKEVMPAANESVKYGLVGVERVGHLADGLRAHYWVEKKKWGYIDTKGNTAIAPQYETARDFSEGRAVVAVGKGYQVAYSVIDTEGKVIFTTSPTTLASDFHNGMMVVNDEENGVDNVYDRNGKLLKSYRQVTPFYNGYAWTVEGDGALGSPNYVAVVDTGFDIVNRLGISYLERKPDNLYGFKTGESGFVTMKIDEHATILLPNGTPVARSAQEGSIGSMTEEMVAAVDLEAYDNQKLGFVNPEGEFTLLFKTEQTQLTSPVRIYDNPGDPFHPQTDKGEECRLVDEIVFTWMIPEPPAGTGSVKSEKYRVNVVAVPAEGGTVSGSGEYEAGQPFTVEAIPSDGWRLLSLSSEELYLNTEGSTVSRLMPSRDVTLTARFGKPENIEKPARAGAMQGTHTFGQEGVFKGEAVIYLEMSDSADIASPYGDATFGFLTVVLDSKKTVEATLPDLGTLKMKNFFAPMRVCGLMTQNDTTYLVVEGGQLMAGGIEFNTPANPLYQFYYNFFSDFYGRTPASLNSGLYRIRMTESASGEITLGRMERYHTELGWLPGDSEAFKAVLTCVDRMMMKRDNNASIPAYLFEGVVLKPAAKREVEWTPSSSWFNDAETAASQTEQLLRSYGTYRSDYERYWK